MSLAILNRLGIISYTQGNCKHYFCFLKNYFSGGGAFRAGAVGNYIQLTRPTPLIRPACRRATFPGGEGFRRFLPHCGGEPGVAAAEPGTQAGGPLCPSRRHPEPARPPPSAPYTAPPTRERHRFLREPSPGSGNPPAARGVLFSHFPIFSPPALSAGHNIPCIYLSL